MARYPLRFYVPSMVLLMVLRMLLFVVLLLFCAQIAFLFALSRVKPR
jgi:hypothetical protein